MTQAATLLEQAGDSAMKQKVKDVEEAFGFNPAPFSLEAVVSSKKFPPQKVVVYGVPGVGKTSFAATWPDPILLRTEDGAGALDVPTFPQVASAIADMREALNALINGKHNFKTLILDSLDWAEPFVWKEVCREGGKANIEDFGFGKGYIKVDDKWKAI